MIDQVKQFSGSVASKPSYASWTADNSLFAVWMGVNDVGNSYYKSNETELLGMIMEDYFEQVEIMFTAGARNFAFLNVPRKFPFQALVGSIGTESGHSDQQVSNDAFSVKKRPGSRSHGNRTV